MGPAACIDEASRREGHPDNVAACALGYMTVSAVAEGVVTAATCGQDVGWKLLLALPPASLSTERARALLPPPTPAPTPSAMCSGPRCWWRPLRWGAATCFAWQCRTGCTSHTGWRRVRCSGRCCRLPVHAGVLGVALSGAGPGMLLVVEADADTAEIAGRIHAAAGEPELEIIATSIAGGATQSLIHDAEAVYKESVI